MKISAETKLNQARHHARRLAMQALYQWQLTAQGPKDIYTQFVDEREVNRADLEYFHELLFGVVEHQAGLDALLQPHLDRPIEQVDPVERGILRLSVFELKNRPDIPYRVVVNEAIELTKKFGAEGAHKFVNGVLDKLARDLRTVEMRVEK